ncbi:hypothetical protein DPF85_05295 [Limosilactobacillus fermentum]|uniref:hypothetical protein n=1 Tax=Limosilactobacillus fermentum TaxID=1613 RepID=UPI000DBFE7C7|nr:hypothetical protein [Limosilactobacillus fermentum]RAM09994.1 hypothetical protein DPF85_05295 [Limosilactobacillus fermentum]
MKKISLIAAAFLASLSLAACGNSASQHKAKQANSSSKVVHHKKHKKQQHKKKAASSSSSSSASVQSSSNQQQQSQQGQQTQQSQSGNGQLPPATDLHDFVNKYGESPAAYLSNHYGMTPEQAVQSVPNDMKTSGEIQDTYQLQAGQDPFK